MLLDPRTNGYEHARNLLRTAILDRYPMMDLVLFLPDDDGAQRDSGFLALEEEFNASAEQSGRGTRLFCCSAKQEVEVWLLAGHSEKLIAEQWSWAAIRADRSVKENFFRPFLEAYGKDKARFPDEGRRQFMQEGLANYDGIKQRCPELAELERRIRGHLQSRQ